jgi:LPPG:FO 2-phospho-L-lactate transferase
MKISVLAGGVGGAKLVDGLAQILNGDDLSVIVNTGDDLEHFGLYISPDVDTVCYTLAGLSNPQTGWGMADETWQVIQQIGRLGGPTWFNLGDRDLATHLERTRRMRVGETLSQITQVFCDAWGVRTRVLPMSDQRVATIVQTRDEGELAFQDYFVARRCEPVVTGFRFEGIELARPAPGVLEALENADAIILAPSNPWVSIAPILAIPGVLDMLRRKPTIAISPIIGGKALKGPAAKMYQELGIEPSAAVVAWQYRSFLDGFMLDRSDEKDASEIDRWGIILNSTDVIMTDVPDRRRLADEALQFIARL